MIDDMASERTKGGTRDALTAICGDAILHAAG